jgi:hypothetical protein
VESRLGGETLCSRRFIVPVDFAQAFQYKPLSSQIAVSPKIRY